MPSLDEIWNILKPIAEFGIVAVLLWIMIRERRGKDRELKETMEKQIEQERDHSKEMMKLQDKNTQEQFDIIRQYDLTLNSLNATLEKFIASMSEDYED